MQQDVGNKSTSETIKVIIKQVVIITKYYLLLLAICITR